VTTNIQWQTISVTALPPGISVTFDYGDGSEEDTYPAIALLHQRGDDSYHGEVERIVLGYLNTHRGEVEPVDVDNGNNGFGGLVRVNITRAGDMNPADPVDVDGVA
jgi:hypothetical protein